MFLRLPHSANAVDASLISEAIPDGTPRVSAGKSPRISVFYLSDSNLDSFRDALISNRSLSAEIRELISSTWLHGEMFVARQDRETILVSERSYLQFTEVRKLYTAVNAAREQMDASYSQLVSGLQELERFGPARQSSSTA